LDAALRRLFQRRDAHPAYREINEMGEAPVLEFGRERLSQSGRDPRLPGRQVRPLRLAQRRGAARDLRWTLFDNHKFTSYIATLRFPDEPAEDRRDAGDRIPARRALNSLGIVDKHLAAQRFLIGDSLTIADVSLCGVSLLARRIRRELERLPKHRPLARHHRRTARLGASLQADAGTPLPEKKG